MERAEVTFKPMEEYFLISENIIRKRKYKDEGGKWHNRLSPSAVLIGGYLTNYSKKTEDGGQTVCVRKYESLGKTLGVSHGTVANALVQLKQEEILSVPKRSSYLTNFSEVQYKYFLRGEPFFFTDAFTIKWKDPAGERRSEVRPLTVIEGLVLCYFYTKCGNKKKTNAFDCSYADIAYYLGISPRSAWSAVRTLLHADLIFCRAGEKGVNGRIKSTYRLNDGLLCRRKRELRRVLKNAVADPIEQAADARIDRERFYSERRFRAESAAERKKEKFLAVHPEYNNMERDCDTLAREEAKAEALGLPGLPQLQERLAKKQREKRAFLRRFGVTEEDFLPHYACRKCSDTGALPNGRACDCYFRRE